MDSSPRRVLVLTGTRAEYGLLKSPMEAIARHDDLELVVVATGMHLSPRHGSTVDEIRDDGFSVDREVLMSVDGDTGTAMAKSLGVGTMGLADAFGSLDPDIVLLLGDRDEALAGALAAAHMNVPVAHIHGGDAMDGATIDDSIRHSITKFAHIHFPATERSAARVEQLGEEPWRITVCGAPGLDRLRDRSLPDPEGVLASHGIPSDGPLMILVQHPVTTHPERAGDQMSTTLDAVDGFEGHIVLVHPNSDAGSEQILDAIESHLLSEQLYTFDSLPRDEYLALLQRADVMVGNSSSGIIESTWFGLPVVDVGPRQQGRERGSNVVSVPHDREAIAEAIADVVEGRGPTPDPEQGANPYDFGGAGERIANRLATISLGDQLLKKAFNDLSSVVDGGR